MRIRMILAFLALALAGCANDPIDSRSSAAVASEGESIAMAGERSEEKLDQAVLGALELEGLNNVTVQLDGRDVILSGWVYSPDDMVRAHHVVQSVHGVDQVDYLGIRVG